MTPKLSSDLNFFDEKVARIKGRIEEEYDRSLNDSLKSLLKSWNTSEILMSLLAMACFWSRSGHKLFVNAAMVFQQAG